MIRVKLSTAFKDFPLIRQTPGTTGTWGNCIFFINEDVEECDYWVVFENIEGIEKTICSKENTILITGEPPAVKTYKSNFLRQFHTIITSHSNMKHPNVIAKQQGLPWMAGAKYLKTTQRWDCQNFINYDDLSNHKEEAKTKEISVISSSRKVIPGHELRLKFIDQLQKSLEGKIDVFGRGFNEIEDKLEGLAPYKYSVVIENCACNNYWTEKLADAFLAETFPFYYGCPNIHDYFHKDSLVQIDINKVEESIEIIKSTLESNRYEQSKDLLRESKQLILNQYNVFAFIEKYISDFEKSKKNSSKKKSIKIVQEMWYRKEVKKKFDKALSVILRKTKS